MKGLQGKVAVVTGGSSGIGQAIAIRLGEELTVDYNFSKTIERVPCSCGSPDCRGAINLP